jgi:hypothetical protein
MMATMASTNAAPPDKSVSATTMATNTTAATTTASNSPRKGLANDDIDTALFDSLNASIADILTDNIDTALKTGVSTLPLMNDNDNNDPTADSTTGTRSEKLLSALRKIYWRNVDVFEVYSGRNIFSVGMYPPKRRRVIEQLYNTDNGETTSSSASKSNKKAPLRDVSASKMNETTNNSSSSSIHKMIHSATNTNSYPTREEIPTAQQMATMTEETEMLREQLWQVQRRRNEVVSEMNQLDVAEQLADMASSTMQETVADGIEQVHDSVTAAVVGSEGLEQLQAVGKELVETLEQEKRQRSDDGDDNDNDDVDMLTAAKKKKEWTLEERYQEERKTFSNPESLANVQRMIQEQ